MKRSEKTRGAVRHTMGHERKEWVGKDVCRKRQKALKRSHLITFYVKSQTDSDNLSQTEEIVSARQVAGAQEITKMQVTSN